MASQWQLTSETDSAQLGPRKAEAPNVVHAQQWLVPDGGSLAQTSGSWRKVGAAKVEYRFSISRTRLPRSRWAASVLSRVFFNHRTLSFQ